MKDPVLAVKTIKPAWSKVSLTLKAEGGLHYLRGNAKPHFSLSKEEHRKGHPNQCQGGGCDHETILKHWPRFADLAALHLSDIDGKPMHADANGWYDLAGALPDNAGEQYHVGNSERHFPKPEGAPRKHKWETTDYRTPTPDECLQIFADHVRVDVETAAALRDKIVHIWKDNREADETVQGVPVWTKGSWSSTRKWFSRWIADQAPRWKAEADACIKNHGLKVYGDKWEAA